ncbi:universal stress protein [Luteimonas vadosa]|uniref:Universal stress protein n=1 Tax=Luteimonas vadosa TaxID=1165507 RepID=A0ABP9DT03_9GAMM
MSHDAAPLIHADGRVLAAIDPSHYATSVARYAAWAATRMAAPLELLHAIDHVHGKPATTDLSGNLALGAQDTLLDQLAAVDEQRGKLAQRQGRALLDAARAQVAESHGIPAGTRQRHGTLLESLLELEPGVRLFVLGKRGEHADFASGHLGSNLERVVRAVHRPVLVAARAFKPVERFLIAFDGSATTRKCVEMVGASPLLQGLEAHVLMVGEANVAADAHLDWARTQLQAAGFDPIVECLPGTPDTLIAQQVTERKIDLLVMGAYGHSRIRSLILGSTTTQVLRSCQIAVLLLR